MENQKTKISTGNTGARDEEENCTQEAEIIRARTCSERSCDRSGIRIRVPPNHGSRGASVLPRVPREPRGESSLRRFLRDRRDPQRRGEAAIRTIGQRDTTAMSLDHFATDRESEAGTGRLRRIERQQ